MDDKGYKVDAKGYKVDDKGYKVDATRGPPSPTWLLGYSPREVRGRAQQHEAFDSAWPVQTNPKISVPFGLQIGIEVHVLVVNWR